MTFDRYMLFDVSHLSQYRKPYSEWEPAGGLSDCMESYADLGEAYERASKWFAVEVFDRIEGRVIACLGTRVPDGNRFTKVPA